MKLTYAAAKKYHSGWDEPRGHKGQDYGWGAGGQVITAAPGTVVSVYGDGGYNGGWGNQVIVEYATDVYGTYSHLATGTILVHVGQAVSRGQQIALMGNTGNSTAKHLHEELRIGGIGAGHRVDPAPYYYKDLPGTGSEETSPAQPEEEEEEMNIGMYRLVGKTYHVTIGNPVSGFKLKYQTGSSAYNNLKADQFKTGNFTQEDQSVIDRFEQALDAVRQGK